MIPENKLAAVARGLREAFGVAEADDISRLSGGLSSSLVFRLIVRGAAYVLKLVVRKGDQTRHYRNMKAAADAGLAPRVWYTSVEDQTAITDFVAAEPMSLAEARLRLPAVLRRLHDLPPFEQSPFNTSCTFLLDKGPALDGFLQQFEAANALPAPEREELFARYAELAAVYPRDDGERVSSHNDLFKPDNILFDGERVWLVDWEASFLNDRYADLAVVANQVVTSDDEELACLQAYFGVSPDPYQQARFHLMQQLAHVFYTMGFLLLGSSTRSVDWSGPVPGFADHQRRMWAGDVDLADPDAKVLYGKVRWQRLVENVRRPRYREALRIVSDRHQAG